MKLSTNFLAMLGLVGRIKSSLNCNPSLELRDITHAHTHIHTYLLVEFQSWVCIHYKVMDVFALLRSWITHVCHVHDTCMLYLSLYLIGQLAFCEINYPTLFHCSVCGMITLQPILCFNCMHFCTELYVYVQVCVIIFLIYE